MTTLFLEALLAIALSLSILMGLAWVVQQRTGNSGWVDTIWTFAVGLVGAGSALWPVGGEAPNARQWLVAALVVVWSLRLGTHIAIRTASITDDPRYAAFAKEWGVNSARRMFLFLQNQAFGSIPLVFAIFVAARFPQAELRWQDVLGALILLVGIAGEALADAQLRQFRNQPANQGRVCDAGLWRWSRHPNYFFEWFCWLAYPVIGLSFAYPFAYPLAYPWGLATLLAPLFMYWILVYVTGIPPLEAQMLRSRGEHYRAYQSRTSKFFPQKPHA
jgi:steroid 5-alpha reductase family enzyme